MTESISFVPPAEASFPLFWGIDIGGTNIKVGLVDSTGQTLAYEIIPTEESKGAQAAVNRTAAQVTAIENRLGLQREQIPRIGLGAPGSMDLPAGMLIEPPNLPNWWQFPIRDSIAKALGRPVSFLNDANAAAYGEFWLGAGREHSSMILLTLGTGVGGGIIVNDELINGVNSFGSECGHVIVNSASDAQLCVWGGGRGQLEAYASASAVVQRTRQRLTDGASSQLKGLLGGGDQELTAKKVYEAAIAGDTVANEIIDETARWLGIGVTILVHTIDPGLVVLGGAMDFGGADSPVGQRFLQKIKDEFEERTFANVFAGTKLEFATLTSNAGYLGAAGYARKEQIDSETKTQTR
ncbi:Glucokinase [Roseimaritima multifibrata]|uniref:Glucokinase n=1 Tax=Roseimaritima multifibrata TaxID=1930274 RepID=A0A517MBY1_9BACT|nr:ROK family protein [Roseimaritima multifibrata]QDS92398.1 Glucokinase [Roseimaritima multifibrata]